MANLRDGSELVTALVDGVEASMDNGLTLPLLVVVTGADARAVFELQNDGSTSWLQGFDAQVVHFPVRLAILDKQGRVFLRTLTDAAEVEADEIEAALN